MTIDAATFSGGVLWRTIFRTLLGELGDKTFFLTVIFAAWCPLNGIREGSTTQSQRIFVCLGAFCSLVLWSVLYDSGYVARYGDGVWNFAACSVTGIIGCKAALELQNLDSRVGEPLFNRPATANNTTYAATPTTAQAPVKWNPVVVGGVDAESQSFAALSKGSEAAGVASSATVEKGPQGAAAVAPTDKKRTPEEKWTPLTYIYYLGASFWIPFGCAFLCEVSDKSSYTLLQGSHNGFDFTIGVLIGAMIVVTIAGIAGFIFERTLSDARILFTATMVLYGVSLIGATQGVINIGILKT